MARPVCKHEWDFIAESSQSSNEWCPRCGAWKRLDYETGKTNIYKPKEKA